MIFLHLLITNRFFILFLLYHKRAIQIVVTVINIEKNIIIHISINHDYLFFVPKRQKAAPIMEAVF